MHFNSVPDLLYAGHNSLKYFLLKLGKFSIETPNTVNILQLFVANPPVYLDFSLS